jgi:hypothetical protein
MRAHRVTSVAYVSMLVLACIGMTGALGAVFVLLSGDVTAGAVAWAVACGVLALCLLAGVLTHDRKPVRATVLLVVGSPAIAVAWFWLPPAYLLSVALAVAALMCRPRARVAPAA